MNNEVWTERNEMKHEQWSVEWKKLDKAWTMRCGLKEMRWNMINEVWTEGNEMKLEQCGVDWRKRDETWTMKCGLKEVRWNMNNKVGNVLSMVKISWF